MPAHEHNPSPLEEEIQLLKNSAQPPLHDCFPPVLSPEEQEMHYRHLAVKNLGDNWDDTYIDKHQVWMLGSFTDASYLFLGNDEWRAWLRFLNTHKNDYKAEVSKHDPYYGKYMFRNVELIHVYKQTFWQFA